jgi:hypothetical protein
LFETLVGRAKKTFQLELIREFFEGVVQSATHSVSLLILIEVFIKPAGIKGEVEQAVLFGSTYAGMCISIFVVPYLRRFEYSGIFWILVINTVCGILLILSGFVDSMLMHTLLCSAAFALLPLRLPYFTEIYHQNYPKENRGMFHGLTLLTFQVAMTGFSYIAGKALFADIESWRLIIVCVGISALISNVFVYPIPKPKAHTRAKINIFSALKTPFKDKLFGYVVLVWFIFGFAHLWIYPIRIQYLSIELGMNPAKVALLAIVAQEGIRFVFIPIWSYLFDHYNFIVLRICLNISLGIGLWIYFHSESDWAIALGSAFIGICTAGGSVTWNLWITKFVPSHKTAEYMSVHIASSGIKGLTGPFLGFLILGLLGHNVRSYQMLSEISVGMVVLSVAMLIPVIKMGNRQSE